MAVRAAIFCFVAALCFLPEPTTQVLCQIGDCVSACLYSDPIKVQCLESVVRNITKLKSRRLGYDNERTTVPTTHMSIVLTEEIATDVIRTLLAHVHFFMHHIVNTATTVGSYYRPLVSMWTAASDWRSSYSDDHFAPIVGDYDMFMVEAVVRETHGQSREFVGRAVHNVASRYKALLRDDNIKRISLSPTLDLIFSDQNRWNDCVMLFVLPYTAYVTYSRRDVDALAAWNCTVHAIVDFREFPDSLHVAFSSDAYLTILPGAPPALYKWTSPLPPELKERVVRMTYGFSNVVFDTGGTIFNSQSLYLDATNPAGQELHSRARYIMAEVLARQSVRFDNEFYSETGKCQCGDGRVDPEMLNYHAINISESSRSPYRRSLVPPLRDRGCLTYCEDQLPRPELLSQEPNINPKYATCSTEAVYTAPYGNSTKCIEPAQPPQDGTTSTYQQVTRIADIVVIVEESVQFKNSHRLLPGILLALERNLQRHGFGTNKSTEPNRYVIIGIGANEGFLGRFILSACSRSYSFPIECVSSAVTKLQATASDDSNIDSYASLVFAIANTPWRSEAMRNILLLSHRDWYPGHGSTGVTTSTINHLLSCYDISLHAFVDNRFTGETGSPVDGTGSENQYIFNNGIVGSTGPTSIGSGFRRTTAHLVIPALKSGGSAWDIQRMTSGSVAQHSPPAIANINAKRHSTLFPCSECEAPGSGTGDGMAVKEDTQCSQACDQAACAQAVQDEAKERLEKEREAFVSEAEVQYQNMTGCEYSLPEELLAGGCAIMPANVFLLVDLGEENYQVHNWLPDFVSKLETGLISNDIGQGKGVPLARRNLYTVIGFDHERIQLVQSGTGVQSELVAEAIASLQFPARYKNEGNGFKALTDIKPVVASSRLEAYNILLLISANSADVQPFTNTSVPQLDFYCRQMFHHFLVPRKMYLAVGNGYTGLMYHSVYGAAHNGSAVHFWDWRDQDSPVVSLESTTSRYLDLTKTYRGYIWNIGDIEELNYIDNMTQSIASSLARTVKQRARSLYKHHQCIQRDGLRTCQHPVSWTDQCPPPVTAPVTSTVTSSIVSPTEHVTVESVSSDGDGAAHDNTLQTSTGPSPFSLSTSRSSSTPHVSSSETVMAAAERRSTGGNLLATVVASVVSGFLLLVIVCLLLVYRRMRRAEKTKKSLSTVAQLTATPFPGIEATAKHAAAMLVAPINSSVKVIPSSLLRVGRCIGKGQFGVVHLGWLASKDEKSRSVEEVVAMKTLHSRCTDEASNSSLIEEYLLQKNIGSHPNVVDMIMGGLYEGRACMVMEYMSGGDLHTFLRNIKKSQKLPTAVLTSSESVDICRQVSCGMQFLASKQVIHRDLAARNILVREHLGKLDVKISDLGLSRCSLQNGVYEAQTSRLLPMKWMAPESMMEGRFSLASDVWSFGVLMWEVEMCGEMPYKGKPNALLPELLAKGHRLERPEGCHDDIYRLMLLCWSADPEERPSFNDIIEKLNTQLETHMNYIQVEEASTDITIVIESESVGGGVTCASGGRRPSALQYLLEQMRERSLGEQDVDRFTPVVSRGSDDDWDSDTSPFGTPVDPAAAPLSHNSAMLHRYVLQPSHGGSREEVFEEHNPPPASIVE